MFESIANFLSSTMKTGTYDYCNLESVEGPDSDMLVTKEGGLVTLMELQGSYSTYGSNRYDESILLAFERLSGVLDKPGFKIDFVFVRDSESSAMSIKPSIAAMLNSVKRNNLALTSLCKNKYQFMAKRTCAERAYIVITTTAGAMSSYATKAAMKDRVDGAVAEGLGIKPGEFGQSTNTIIRSLVELHKGFVNNIEEIMGAITQVNTCKVREALSIIKREIAPEFYTPDWKPYIEGDKLLLSNDRYSTNKNDISHAMHPSLAFQLFSTAPEVVEGNLVEVGENFYSPLLVDMPAHDPKPFQELFDSIDKNIPWRIKVSIETGHEIALGKVSSKHTVASLLKLTAKFNNGQIQKAADDLQELAKNEVLTLCRINFCTWGKSKRAALQNKAMVIQAIQSWGQTSVIEEKGDPIEGWLSSLPAIMKKEVSPTFVVPLGDIILTLPFTRPSSPWKTGAMLYRTVDEKLFPVGLGTSKQTSWTDLTYAPMGYGKSFKLAADNTALLLTPNAQGMLPRIGILDVGFSSANYVKFIKEALPMNQKHLAQTYTMENTIDHAINPFDTPLGCRHPLSVDKGFLDNIMALLLTPAGTESVEKLGELVSALTRQMYIYFDEKPKKYDIGIDLEVDAKLQAYNFTQKEGRTSWWSVVDFLHSHGEYHHAMLAQRYAVPTLTDATKVLNTDVVVKDVFGKSKANDESLMNMLSTMIISATDEYKVLSAPTRFDIGESRIVSLDLQNVAQGGSPSADKMCAIMYMLGRFVLAKEYYRKKETTLPQIPEAYRAYHAERLDKEAGVPRKLCYDEFHRTASVKQIREQVLRDIREGRKYAVHISLLSQFATDFDEEMVKAANNIFIMSKGNGNIELEEIITRFSPSVDSIRALTRHVNGPSPVNGSSMLYIGNIKDSRERVEQVLYLTLSPKELWAFSTVDEDNEMRGRMADRIGLDNALDILSSEFPKGIKEYIDTRAAEYEGEANLFETIASEVIDKHRQKLAA
ncbi:hypothetical protein [Neptuniibacter sp. QD37_11]|uniref:hypothetical protein n=1 Tax=Neptuniibacter sp. QD37_11 TaxID=3398209 RepID=UPI0039F5F4B7